ncbi:MAG: WD40 repeat domain-containing protein [Myxococcales bacterium]|nr:WD40 repeat domain-containing protein [Myxococcales bacterium]
MPVPRSILALVCCSAACGPAVVGTPPLPTPTPKAPVVPPVPAKLSFPFHPFAALRTLEVAEGELQVGPLGRRALRKAGATVEGPALPEGIAGVLRLPGDQLGFVAESGATYVTKDALGPVLERRAGPTAAIHRVAVGKRSIVAVSARELFRSADGGRTWEPAEIAAHREHLRRRRRALSAKGEGLLFTIPQRVFATSDDGATWSAIDSLGLGVHAVTRDGPTEGASVQIDGEAGRATLVNGKLVALPANNAPWVSGPWYQTRLGGPWLLVSGHDEGVFRFYLGRAGETLTLTNLPKGCSSPNTMGDESGLFLSCPGDGALHRWTKDGGWKTLRTYEGSIDESEVDLFADAGVVYQGRACHDGTCEPRKIAFDGATFVDVQLAAKGYVHAVAFDPKSRRGYVVAESDGRLSIHAAAPNSATFERTTWLDLEAAAHGGARASVGDDGVLRVAVCRADGSACSLRAYREGVAEPVRWLGPSRDLSLAGKRGIWVDARGAVFETADGGATWARIALPAERDELTCNDWGCVRHDTVRVGWDLPALPLPTISSSLVEPPVVSAPKVAKRKVTCTPTGPTIPANVPAEVLERKDGFSWLEADKDGAVVARGAGAKSTSLELLKAPKAGKAKLHVVDGVAIRITSTTTTLFEPTLEVAWVPLGATKPTRAKLPVIKLTNPPIGVVTGSRVTGGVVVRVDDKVFFVDDKGKAKPLELDPLDTFARTSKGFVAARRLAGGVKLSWSGEPTGRASWLLQPYGADAPFAQLFTSAEGVFVGAIADEVPFLVAVPDARAPDPSTLRYPEPGVAADKNLCLEPFASTTFLPSVDPRTPLAWEVSVEGLEKPLPGLLTLRPEKGKLCAATLVATSPEHRVRVPLTTLDKGWLVTKEGIRPLACKL